MIPEPEERKPDYKRLKSINEMLERLTENGLVLPQAIEAEKALLNKMMYGQEHRDTAFEIIGEIESNDGGPFYDYGHTIVYRTLYSMARENKPINPITLKDRLLRRGNLAKIGGMRGFADIITETLGSYHPIADYANLIMEKYAARALIEHCKIAEMHAYDGMPAIETTDYLETKLDAIVRAKSRKKEFEQGGAVAARGIALTRTAGELVLPGAPSGIEWLDSKTGGFRRGRFYVFAARPAVGKSALADECALAALFSDRPTGVCFFSGEMTSEEVTFRMIANMTLLNSVSIERGHLSPEEWGIVDSAVEKLKAAPLFIDDTPGIRPLELRSRIRKIQRKHEIGVVFVDYLQLLNADYDEKDNVRRVTYVSKALKAMAKDLDVAVVAMASMNRAQEKPYARPNMAQIRESGQVESDSDCVLLLWQHEADDNLDITYRTMILEKNRSGPVGEYRIEFNKTQSRFYDALADSRAPVVFPEFGEQIPF